MGIFGCIAGGIAWIFCTAAGSLLASCCGNDKPSTVPPGVNSGRKRSILLLLISIGLSLFYQYYVGPALKPESIDSYNPVLAYVAESWVDGCEFTTEDQDGNEVYNEELREKCSGYNGVYRVAGSTLIFYLLAGVAAVCKPSANREAWPAKFVLFLFMVAGTLFLPNDPLFDPILLNIFRIGAVSYIIFNQLIILDMAYNINESCVEKADKAELDEGEGAGRKWLLILIGSSAIMFIASFVAIGLMFHYFSGCKSNTAFISITLIVGILSTVLQLMGVEASLFTSACIFAYSTFLCYTAVSKNTNGQCNPQLGEENVANVILGLAVAIIAILWTGYSATAYRAVGQKSDNVGGESDDNEEQAVGGVVVNGANEESNLVGSNNGDDENGEEEERTFSSSWVLNCILASITCWYAMTLTSWGSIASSGNLANPGAGDVSMWMVIASQWLMNALYCWTLIASKVFPDRDFS